MSTETLTLDSQTLFTTASNSPFLSPPPIPPDFPQSKLIPNTRFIVDGFRFSGDYSAAYFLSHFHSDHYTGISSNWSNGIIFCSQITAHLLIQVLRVNPLFVYPLQMSKSVYIDGCEVALVDANHCPGAVQFLFKLPVNGEKFERYVHTGDFRYCDEMKLVPILSEYVGCEAVFLDTTYCNPKFVFPSQQESIDHIVSVIERIKGENEGCAKSVLFFVATYVIGKEKILQEIARRCGRKIWVDSRKMSILGVLGLTSDGIFTEEESESDVHVVGWNVLGETWPYFRPNFVKMREIMNEKGYSKVVGFVPTGWTYEVKRNKFSVRTKDVFEIHLVPYSEHSNYDELREYVRFLKPKRVLPTVGVDVEKLDSKHANSMRKHFAGLVDEMANKHEFLMGFHRSKEMQAHDPKTKDELDKKIVLENSHGMDILNDNEKEEIIQQLRDCLPSWVTRDQMLDLINFSGGNFVEAVSHFFEHETEFHEQIKSALSACTSQSEINDESTSSLAKPSSLSSPQKKNDFPLTQTLKSLGTKNSPKSSLSPVKNKRKGEHKPNKRAKSKSILQSSGPKQSTITSFFTKVTPNVSEYDGDENLLEESGKDTDCTSNESLNIYKEKVDQFIQIVNGRESLRSYAESILDETKGDINLAVDKYYASPEGGLGENKQGVVNCETLAQAEPSTWSFISQKGKIAPEVSGEMATLHVQPLLPENKSKNLLSLPLEKYSPIKHACWKRGQPAPYIHLARSFELVEGEKGKIKATSMLCNMFRSLLALSAEDVLPAVYLCTNKIAPDHENKELNVGGSIVVAALEEACGTNKLKIKELHDTLGDLGDVAQLCRQTQSLLAPPPPLSISGVFSALRKISEQTGSGSTTRRKNIIVNLMRSCREKEMKFIVRTLVRNLRIGAMMRTVLPALAQAVVMNTSPHGGVVENLKEKLQGLSAATVESYNILPNLDLLVPCLLNNGIEFSSITLSMVPGVPIKPMLAKITNGIPQVLKNFQNKAFTCEYKYDGQRAQIHRLADGSVRAFSRNGDETTMKFPDLVNIIQESCSSGAATFVVDAEVVAVDRKNGHKLLSFQELSSREKGGKYSLIAVENIKVDICVFVFDIMFANGEKLLDLPLRLRRKHMKDLFRHEKLGYFEYAKEITVEADDSSLSNESTLTMMKSFLDRAISSSCEGLMVKSLDVDAFYLPSKRSDSWLKVKRDYVEGLGDSLDLVPIGAWHGNGRKAGWYSPFLMACYEPDTQEFQSVCRVMSGFSDAFYIEMKEFYSGDKVLAKKPVYYHTGEAPDMWFSAELVWEIKGADFTVSPVHKAAVGLVHPSRGISVRFPRFIRSLSDRKPEECSTSTDVADMFNSQTRKIDVTAES